MYLDILLDITAKAIELLIEQYDKKQLSFEDFKKHTEIKLRFLSGYKDFVEPSCRQKADEIIEECEAILNSESAYI